MDPKAVDAQEIRDKVIAILRSCFDPEIPVNIYDLGLIYAIDVAPDGAVNVKMTLTSPGCPVAGTLPPEVENKVRSLDRVPASKVVVVWDPPWSPAMMSEAAKLQLGFME